MKVAILIGFLAASVAAHKVHQPELIQVESVKTQDEFLGLEDTQRVEAIEFRDLCIYENEQSFYDFRPLRNDQKDYNVSLQDQGISYSIQFNFCRVVQSTHCTNVQAGLLSIAGEENPQCYPLATESARDGVSTRLVNERIYTDQEQQYVRNDDQRYGRLDLFYDSGLPCNDTFPPTRLRIQMFCDLSADEPVVVLSDNNWQTCQVSVKLTSKHACYKWSANPLMRWLGDNQYIFGAVLIVFGVAIGLFGKKLFKPAICMVGSLAFTLIGSLFIFSIFFTRDTPDYIEWIVFSVCAVVGIIVGLLLAWLMRLGVGVLAGWGGFCLGLILYNLFIYKIDNQGKAAFWSVTITLAVIAAVLSLWLFWHAIIIATSISGSYALIRGISMYTGGFPDEMEIVYRIQYGEFVSMPYTFYIFFVFFVIIAIGFIVFQYKKFGKTGDKQQHPYHRYGRKY